MTGIPKELDMQMGRKLLLRIKISKYNEENPGSSLNVSEFTVCEDLMEQFNAATSEVMQFVHSWTWHMHKWTDSRRSFITNFKIYTQTQTSAVLTAKDIKDNANKDTSTASTVAGSSQSIDLTQENSTINLSDDTPLAQARGKRRIASTLRGDKTIDSPALTPGSTVHSDGRLLKAVKQEKP